MVDLVALMLHEQEEVAEIVRVGNGIAQVRFQHGTERRLTFGLTEPFNMLIGMGGGSLSKELYDWFGYTPSTATASAFVQQRNKIRSKAVEMIFNEFVALAMPTMTFRGYRLFAVDGSDLRLPYDPTNDFSLIRNAEGQKQYNLAHLNAMFDLMSKAYVDVTMQGKKGMNEHKALISMIDRSNIPGKVIVLMDRGYESFNNIAHLQEKKWNFIIRAKESYGMISNLQLPNSEEFDVDTTLTLTRRQTKETLALLSAYPERYRWIQPHTTFDYIAPKDPAMYDLRFRVVRFRISGGYYETVYTNLDSETFPIGTIKELYRLRWGIETSFRELELTVIILCGVADGVCLGPKKQNDLVGELLQCPLCGRFQKRGQLSADQKQRRKDSAEIIMEQLSRVLRRQFRHLLQKCGRSGKQPVRCQRVSVLLQPNNCAADLSCCQGCAEHFPRCFRQLVRFIHNDCAGIREDGL